VRARRERIGDYLGLPAESVPADQLQAYFGGFLAVPVIAACIVDPLVSDMEPIASLVLRNVLPGSEQGATLAANAATVVPLIWGLSSPQAIEKMKADTTTISCPTLSINDSHDYPELLQQASAAIAHITEPGTRQHLFTPADGGSYRQLDNFGLKHRVMFDWLDEVLAQPR
jgi:hypothetical protein